MKILHLTKKYPNAIGGDATVVCNLEKLHSIDHEIYILTHNCPEINGENVFKFGLQDRSSNLDRMTFRRILSLIILIFWGLKNLRGLRPDIIHSHSADLGFFISVPARFYKIPLVNTCHGISFPYSQYSLLKRFMEKFFLRNAGFKRIIAIDKNSLRLLEGAGFDAMYIPNGVEVEKFDKKIVTGEKIRFLFVGRLESQKGLNYLIEAVDLLKDDFEVLIVGEGSQRKELEEIVNDLGIGEVVMFLGQKDGAELIDAYLSSDVFVLPSIWEGLPLSLLEAMAAGLPAIVTDVGGIPYLCIDNENALLINPKKPDELAEAMERLIDDGELRNRLGENSRALIKNKFSWKRTAADTLKVYQDVI